ncbi:serine protease SP24D-like [Anopheles darlingi]|uniref:serine protease SP24D-like n=1 Tax=Anopheles darlingi TaxID=43151 RepID=UPI002100410D|nr:serine protease SP24D-like [Anopheles darlingi]
MIRGSVAVCLVFAAIIGPALSGPVSNRIVGGQLADDTQLPYQIALFYEGRFRCGGSIIGDRLVLTAAHCVVEENEILDAKLLTVHAGSASLKEGGRRYTVKRAIAHEGYAAFQNDIAVLEMKEAFQYNNYTQPIELAEREVPIGSQVLISGYGRVGDGQPTSDVLLYNTMYVVENEVCQEITEAYGSGLICLDKKGSHGACNGDSGGPAAYDGKLVGVANFIIEYCGGDYPDGYAKVAYYIDWIRQFLP